MIHTPLTNRRVLITGATGGLGLALVAAFSKAHYIVTATGRSAANREKLEAHNATFIQADLTDQNSLMQLCKKQDIIIHAAALSSSWDTPVKFDEINLQATENLLKAANASGSNRFIYISSPSIYATMHDQYNLTEASPIPTAPLNDYARTKLLAERLVLSHDRENFLTVALRPRAIVGPDDKVLLPKILNLVKSGTLPVFRKGKAVIELTDVRDVANAVLLAEQKIENIHGCSINISGGKSITVKELAERIANLTNCRPRFVEIPMPFAKAIAWVSEWIGALRGYTKEPRLTRYMLATLAYSQTFDLSLAKEKLGFSPAHNAILTILECAKKEMS